MEERLSQYQNNIDQIYNKELEKVSLIKKNHDKTKVQEKLDDLIAKCKKYRDYIKSESPLQFYIYKLEDHYFAKLDILTLLNHQPFIFDNQYLPGDMQLNEFGVFDRTINLKSDGKEETPCISLKSLKQVAHTCLQAFYLP